ncbi:MAG: permease-like cell division protein FtsX [Finegoldia sp.]|nr:permease-like cell division protein FtsX [Finegoldia sp.]
MEKIRIIKSTFKEGLKGVWDNRSMGFSAILTIAMALFILGAVLISILTLNQSVKDFKDKLNVVNVYVDTDANDEKVKLIGDVISKMDGIESVKYISKERAKKSFSESLEDESLIEGMDEAFPASYELVLKDISQADKYIEELKGIDGVYKVSYFRDLVLKILNISRIVRIMGTIVVGVLLFISALNIYNTIRITVQSRSKEILIKKGIGASPTVISSPLVIEGIIYGIIGSLIGFLAIYYLYKYGYLRYNELVFGVLSTYLVPAELIKVNMLEIFISLGVAIGAVGSSLSSMKYLKFGRGN